MALLTPRPPTRLPRALAAPLATAAAFFLLSGCASGAMDSDDPEGRWGSPDPGMPEITLEDDGQAHGTDGCNRFTGTWRVDEEDTGDEGTAVVFVDFASTLMACDDIDTWFAEATGARIHDDTMHCLNVDGVEIGSLPRQ